MPRADGVSRSRRPVTSGRREREILLMREGGLERERRELLVARVYKAAAHATLAGFYFGERERDLFGAKLVRGVWNARRGVRALRCIYICVCLWYDDTVFDVINGSILNGETTIYGDVSILANV